MKKRCMAFLLTALFLCQPLLGLAEETAAALQIEDRVGERSGASFSLPQFGDEPEINQYYLELAARLEAGELPPGAVWSADDEGSEPESWVLDYEIIRNDAEYLSVVLHLRQLSGNGETETLSADTFLRGDEPRKITLSELLGTEESDGSAQPVDLVYDLIWEIVQVGMENVEGDYLDGLTLDSVRSALDPETDFYLDDNGNIVFFVEPGLLAGEIAGVLLYPFSPYELRGSAPEAGLRAYGRAGMYR